MDYLKRYFTSIEMAHRIRNNFISPKNAWRIYQNVWLPAGQYPLACTTCTKKESEKLMSPFLNAILPKLGLNHQNMGDSRWAISLLSRDISASNI
eukprot:11605550-Ditylum_brightwellii.AAC.1